MEVLILIPNRDDLGSLYLFIHSLSFSESVGFQDTYAGPHVSQCSYSADWARLHLVVFACMDSPGFSGLLFTV